jgi:hypothetical protein
VSFLFNYAAIGFFFVILASNSMALFGYLIFSSAQPGWNARFTTSISFNLLVGLIALIAMFAVYYDRTVFRGIDYADIGIAAVRAEMNRAGERGGLLSNFGNLFSVAIYLPLINIIFDWEKWSRGRYGVLAIVIVGLGGLVYLTAGRTVVLVAIALITAAMLGRGAVGLPRLPSFLTVGRLVVSLAAILMLFGMIFALRADAFGAADAGDYLSQLCIHLAQPAIEIMSQCPATVRVSRVSWLDGFFNYSTAVLLYAFHVSWVSDAIISDNDQSVTTTFTGIQDLFLTRFGYQFSVTDYDGYFIPAASGLIHDFGYWITGIVFIGLGAMLKIFERNMQHGRMFLGRIAFCYVGGGLMLCVLISPINLPFFLLSIIAIGLIAVVTKLAAVFFGPQIRPPKMVDAV